MITKAKKISEKVEQFSAGTNMANRRQN